MMPNVDTENNHTLNVQMSVLLGYKQCGMTVHTISRALGYDGTGNKLLLSWEECQTKYNKFSNTANSTRPKVTSIYEGMSAEDKAQKAKVVLEGLRRADFVEKMAELNLAKMAKPDKRLKRAELQEIERALRRNRWSELKPGE